jgi:cytoskeleton protein RodZ
MASEAGGQDVRGIGARLRAAREKKGLTVLQAAEKLHVDARVLEALEAQDFAALGADVYVRGHLRRYADLIGESPLELQELYASSTQAARPDLTRIARSQAARHSSPLVLPAVLLVVGFAIAGLLWWALTLPGEKAHPLAPAPGTAAGPPAPGAAPEPAGSASGTAAHPVSRGAVPQASGGRAQLDLKFSSESWVEISDADGGRLLHGLFEAGSARTLYGTPPLRVVLGNSAAVALQMNERPVAIEGLVHRDGSAHLLIDGDGHATAAAPRLAHGD